MEKIIFLDIDSTIINGDWNCEDIDVRPYFKDFLLLLLQLGYEPILYTAGNKVHAFHVCATLVRDWGIKPAIAMKMYDQSLTRDNCPMVDMDGMFGTEKSLHKACEVLGRKIEEVHVHIDDHPDISRWSMQGKRMWCKPYEGDVEDTFFFDLINKLKETGKLI
jgi:hypothetical protein